MLKTAVILAVACAGIVPAQAAPLQQIAKMTVKGTVASRCSLGNSPGLLTISTAVPASGKLDPALNGTTFTLSNLMCDAPSKITLKATALRLTVPRGSVPSGQSQTANFTATATGWTTTGATVTTAETTPLGSTAAYTGAAQVQNGAKVGTVQVTVSKFVVVVGPNGNGSKLINGDYAATITLSLTPSS